MPLDVREFLATVRTAADAAVTFEDEGQCRHLLEAMVWSQGRVCPRCGSLRSHAIAGRDAGRRARPGLYQCADKGCRRQFTVTTKTPLHATKLRLGTWLAAMWLVLQSDKGISSVRLAELIGVTQGTAWRIGPALRLMMARSADERLDGVVEVDETLVGGKPRKDPANPEARRGKQGHTTKQPVLLAVERPNSRAPDALGGELSDGPGRVVAVAVPGMSAEAVQAPLDGTVEPTAHLMTDGHRAMATVGKGFVAHDSVNHGALEFVRGIVHTNSAEGFAARIRRTVAGVFHRVSQDHLDHYLDEISFRWRQRAEVGTGSRRTRSGRVVARRLYERIPPVCQTATLLQTAVGRQLRRTRQGGMRILSVEPLFGQ